MEDSVMQSGRAMGKTLEMQRQLGKAIHDACVPGKTPFKAAVCTPKGTFIVTVRQQRRKKPKVQEFSLDADSKRFGANYCKPMIIDEIRQSHL
jgi:hypothetical protein